MPFTADYQCDTCGHVWEAWQRNSDDCPVRCEECGSESFTNLLGGKMAWSNDPNVRNAMLKKRSEDHSAKHFRDNFERERKRIMRR